MFPGGSVRARLDPGQRTERTTTGPCSSTAAPAGLPWVTLQTGPRTRLAAHPATRAWSSRDPTRRRRPGLLGRHRRRGHASSPPDTAAGRELARIGAALPWFAHDALIHYLSPRGLEQYTGGAWGTRDVSQGPVGLLLTLGAYDGAARAWSC